jgi:hypothetical protein
MKTFSIAGVSYGTVGFLPSPNPEIDDGSARIRHRFEFVRGTEIHKVPEKVFSVFPQVEREESERVARKPFLRFGYGRFGPIPLRSVFSQGIESVFRSSRKVRQVGHEPLHELGNVFGDADGFGRRNRVSAVLVALSVGGKERFQNLLDFAFFPCVVRLVRHGVFRLCRKRYRKNPKPKILQPFRDLFERTVQGFLAFFVGPSVVFGESRNEHYGEQRKNEESNRKAFEPLRYVADFAEYLYGKYEQSEEREPMLL